MRYKTKTHRYVGGALETASSFNKSQPVGKEREVDVQNWETQNSQNVTRDVLSSFLSDVMRCCNVIQLV